MSQEGAPSTLEPGQSIRPSVTLDQAKSLILEHFGHEVIKIKELNSYDDKNFYVQTKGTGNNGDGGKFVFKVLNSMDSRKTGHIEAEHDIMFHLASKGVKCPIPHKNLEGKTFSLVAIPAQQIQDGQEKCATKNVPVNLIRLLSFVEGKILYDVPISSKLLNKTGAYIAEIEGFLKDCKQPVLETHSSIWMLGHVTELEKFIYVIQDEPERYQMVLSVISAYKTNVIPVLNSLEKGVVHGDYNEQNVLVQPSTKDEGDFDISGLIDFGDLHVGPYVFELAITICYMMLESMRCQIVDPFESIGHVVAGYATFRKVSDLEFQVMRTLVACRLCQSLVMGAYSYSNDPGNEYLLTTAARGWTLLNQLWNEKTDDEIVQIAKQFI